MHPGDILELRVTGIAHGGIFVARHQGRVVFVPDVIPGETVRARVHDVRKSFARADALEVLDASPHRRAHLWREADLDRVPEDRVGGADLGHIDLVQQRALKAQVLSEAMQRFAGGPVAVAVQAAATSDAAETADGSRWRTRLGLQVDAAGRLGPYAARSHRVVQVRHYPLPTRAIEAAALALDGPQLGRVDLVEPSDGEVRIVRHRHGARRAQVVRQRVGDRDFAVDVDGFWQVHRLAAEILHTAVRSAVQGGGLCDPDAWHLDLYGGVGLLADAIAAAAGPRARIITVESAPRASAHAAANLRHLPRVEAVTGRVERWLADTDVDVSQGVVVLDPPRAGAGRSVIQRLGRLGPQMIIYVACDPVALARDAGFLREHGFVTDAVIGIDLFPNTHHIEAIAVFRR